MPEKKTVPIWFLWFAAHPVFSMLLLAAIVFGVPAAMAVYLDHRIEAISRTSDDVRPQHEPSGAVPTSLPPDVVAGQTVYVPLYSHVYQGEGERLLLAGTLSIRNTDATRHITISAVRYFDTEGKFVRDYLPTPLKLNPMGSTDFLVKESDIRGGPGANFLVEWVAEQPAHEPVIEAVMVGRKGGMAAFVCPGRVVSRIEPAVATVTPAPADHDAP